MQCKKLKSTATEIFVKKNMIMSTFSGVRLLLCLFIIRPAVENIPLAGTNAGGVHKYRLGKTAT